MFARYCKGYQSFYQLIVRVEGAAQTPKVEAQAFKMTRFIRRVVGEHLKLAIRYCVQGDGMNMVATSRLAARSREYGFNDAARLWLQM